MGLTATLVEDAGALEPHLAAWDELAVSARRPYCSPAWMLAWWRHAAPAGAALRVVLASEHGELRGVAPFFAEGGGRYRLLAAKASSRAEPLALAGREEELAEAFAAQLADASPAPRELVFEGVAADSRWPSLLSAAWPGARSPWVYREDVVPAPTVDISGRTYADWLAAKSRHFRQHARRDRRRLEEAGARFQLVTDIGALDAALHAFARLHHARWNARGGSDALSPQVQAMLADSAHGLLGEGRFRLWTIEIGGDTISSHLFLSAGGESVYWLGGFDDEWAEMSPARATVLAAIEDAAARGEERVDLGAGGQDYKYRIADGVETVEWLRLVPRGRHYPLVRLRLAPRQVRRALARRIPKETRKRVKRMFRRRNRE